MNDQKNLLLAIVASLLILLVFQYFFPNKSDIKKIEDKEITLVKFKVQIKSSLKVYEEFEMILFQMLE